MSLNEIFSFSSGIAIKLDKGYCELKVFNVILLVGIVSVFFLLNGCNDTPNSIGKGSLAGGDNGIVHVDTFYATGYSSEPNLIYTSSIDRFMLGKNNTHQAWACIKFSQWPDSLIGTTITGATIRLRGVYHFGDSTASLSFDVLRAKASLANDSLSYDSLSLNGSFYFSNSPIICQSFTPVGDTETTTINILDTTMLREWFSTNTDSTHLNDGLILRPTNSHIIRGFYSFNASDTALQPTLYVTYLDTSGNPVTYSHKIGSSKYVSTVDKANLLTDNKLIYVQCGISYRGLVSFDTLPIPWPVSIYHAVLEITAPAPSSASSDFLYALSVESSGKSDGIAHALSQTSTDSTTGHPVYSFDVRTIAIRWLSNASIRKVAFSGYSESTSFDLFKLYGTGILRPRIIITYPVQR
jgi:hypothetical protein